MKKLIIEFRENENKYEILVQTVTNAGNYDQYIELKKLGAHFTWLDNDEIKAKFQFENYNESIEKLEKLKKIGYKFE